MGGSVSKIFIRENAALKVPRDKDWKRNGENGNRDGNGSTESATSFLHAPRTHVSCAHVCGKEQGLESQQQ
jgi:hypothetical protein